MVMLRAVQDLRNNSHQIPQHPIKPLYGYVVHQPKGQFWILSDGFFKK